MIAQTTIPALDPRPPVVEAVLALGIRLRSCRGSLVGVCPRCVRPVLYVGALTFTCFGCGARGGAKDAAWKLRRAA